MAFRFKQFSVNDSSCAMKVGTDSVLLGAWADYNDNASILDVGTGCGLLALMAAQESEAVVTAIDIDADACRQASENFGNSPWNNRFRCIHLGLEEFTKSHLSNHDQLFDHIITNPPYFINSLKSPDTGRNTARHNDELPLKTLVELSSQLLKDSRKFSIVFPFAESSLLISFATDNALNLSRQLTIIPKQGKDPNRILLEFTKGPVESHETRELAIRDEKGHYTEEYVEMTEKFYLQLKAKG